MNARSNLELQWDSHLDYNENNARLARGKPDAVGAVALTLDTIHAWILVQYIAKGCNHGVEEVIRTPSQNAHATSQPSHLPRTRILTTQ